MLSKGKGELATLRDHPDVSREGFRSTRLGLPQRSIMVTRGEGRMGANMGLLLPIKVRLQRSAAKQQEPSTLHSEQPAHLPTPQEGRKRLSWGAVGWVLFSTYPGKRGLQGITWRDSPAFLLISAAQRLALDSRCETPYGWKRVGRCPEGGVVSWACC